MYLIKNFLTIIFGSHLVSCKPLWTYDIVSANYNSSNTNIADIELKVDRISRGVFGLSGFVDVKMDIDDAVVNVKLYRSSTGNENDYQLLPYEVKDEHLEKAMNDFYKVHLMDTVKECGANTPQFEEFVAPLEKTYFTFSKCVIPTESFPNIMTDGTYKYHATIGQEEQFLLFFEVIINIESNKYEYY